MSIPYLYGFGNSGGIRVPWTHFQFNTNFLLIRTLDSLNEGLPIKMTREKFQRKRYFFYEKDSRLNPRLIQKSSFLIGQVPIEKIWVENSVFAIQHIDNRKRFTEVQ